MEGRTGGRVSYLDGVRGWASLIVLLYHGMFLTFGPIEPAYTYKLASFTVDGALAVSIFFVLSGFALSVRFFETGDRRFVQVLALRRYPRLVIPIFAVCLVAYVLLLLGLFYNQDGAVLLHQPALARQTFEFVPTMWGFLRFSTVDVFFNYVISQSLNPVLWTMAYEFFGSFLVFGTLLLLPNSKIGIGVVFCGVVFVCLYMGSIYVHFLYGVLLAGVSQLPAVSRFRTTRAASALALTLFLMVVLFSAYGGNYRNGYWMPPLAAAAFIAAPVISERFASFFDWRISQFLGRISFPLYLTHYVVICSFVCWLALMAAARGVGLSTIARAGPVITVAVCIVVAMAFYRFEVLAIRTARRFSDWCIGDAERLRARARPDAS